MTPMTLTVPAKEEWVLVLRMTLSGVCALFDVPVDAVEIVVHPESVVHSLVTFADGSTLAQLCPPDMRVPIQYALSWPGRLQSERAPLDLAALGAAAFASAESLALLESIVHPAVLADFRAWRDAVAAGSEAPPPFVVLESAIITQKPLFDGLCDTVVVVYAPEPLRLERVRLRNPGLPEADIRRRIAAQRVDFSRADYLLINDATPDALEPQVAALYTTLSEA